MKGAMLCRDLCCCLVKWKSARWLPAEESGVMGYGQLGATLETRGLSPQPLQGS